MRLSDDSSAQRSAPAVTASRVHGGPDALGVALFDFSTNSNACGPCPSAWAAVRRADATRYPDPRYVALREQLAAFHGVEVGRMVVAGSASECIFRITAWVARSGGASVCVPRQAYGDYAHAAQAWGLGVTHENSQANLVWCCEPSSPLGGAHHPWPVWTQAQQPRSPAGGQALAPPVPTVLDSAYAPLRLSGVPSLSPDQMNQVWQMFSPNKALGLTGVRGAYAIAPAGRQDDVLALEALAPSWPLGAHGVAMLQAWVQPDVQGWQLESLHTLRLWKALQIDLLKALGWTCLPSDANFFCARPPLGEASDPERMVWAAALVSLRDMGIKLRDTASFGLPGHARLGVLPPLAQQALRSALIKIGAYARP